MSAAKTVLACLALALPGLAFTDATDEKPPAMRLSGVLSEIESGSRLISISFGRDVDALLMEKRSKGSRSTDVLSRKRTPDKPDGTAGLLRAPLADNATLNISFRDSPSVANSLDRSPDDLREMKGDVGHIVWFSDPAGNTVELQQDPQVSPG